MSISALPLPLELAKPMVLASDLDTQVRRMFAHGYDAAWRRRRHRLLLLDDK